MSDTATRPPVPTWKWIAAVTAGTGLLITAGLLPTCGVTAPYYTKAEIDSRTADRHTGAQAKEEYEKIYNAILKQQHQLDAHIQQSQDRFDRVNAAREKQYKEITDRLWQIQEETRKRQRP